jgi:hypothetical protein
LEKEPTDKFRKQGQRDEYMSEIILFCPFWFMQDTVSDFLCFSVLIDSGSSFSLQMATLFTKDWCVSCWREKEQKQCPAPQTPTSLGFLPPKEYIDKDCQRLISKSSSAMPAHRASPAIKRTLKTPPNDSHTENNYSYPHAPAKLWEWSCKQGLL